MINKVILLFTVLFLFHFGMKGQKFGLFIPTGEGLSAVLESDDVIYGYLEIYYFTMSEKDSIGFNSWDMEQLDTCSFTQQFSNSILYKQLGCGEIGTDYEIIFPLVELDKMQELVELLFFSDDNKWTSEFAYEPDGAGCYIVIIQGESNTRLEIYCGC